MSEPESFLDDLNEEEIEDKDIDNALVTEPVDSRPVTNSENTLLQPASDINAVVDLYDKFENIKSQLLKDDDTETINNRQFIKKSGWRKIATAFNISVETIEEDKIVEDEVIYWRVKARAIAPNGKVATGTAICASNESNHMEKVAGNRKTDPEELANEIGADPDDILWVDNAWRRLKPPKEVNEHNIYATASTRAKNRAISDCVGGGDVSAEEISKEDVFND